jgi:cation/acetate symporter
MLGIFYVTPFIYALLGRAFTPGLYVTGDTDSVVLDVPRAVWPGAGGQVLAAVVTAGAFAAFTAAASGLLVSMAGTLTYDVWPRVPFLRRRETADRRGRFRLVAALAMAVPAVVALFVRQEDISVLVGAALGLAASTFCPLLLLGIWWRRLTARAAAAGMLVGATTATTAIVLGLVLAPGTDTVLGALLAQPAVVTVPIAFAVMIVLSLLERPDATSEASMLAMHRPEPAPPLVTSS